MTRETEPLIGALAERLLMVALTLVALGYVLFAGYPPLALAAILALVFALYVTVRLLIYWENDRFSPQRIQVGLNWAFVGIDPETREFDPRPARAYFVILILLLLGVVVRPVLRWAILGLET